MVKFITDNIKAIIVYIIMSIFLAGGFWAQYNALQARVDTIDNKTITMQEDIDDVSANEEHIAEALDWIKCALNRIETKIDQHIAREE